MTWTRVLATLLCAYLTLLGLGILTGWGSGLIMGPTGSPIHDALAPQVQRYLNLTNPLIGASLLIVAGVAAFVFTWRGALKPQAKKGGKGKH